LYTSLALAIGENDLYPLRERKDIRGEDIPVFGNTLAVRSLRTFIEKDKQLKTSF